MIYKGYNVTIDTRETVFSEYYLLDWDEPGDLIEEYDSADFEILEYIVHVPDVENKYFNTPEEAREWIDNNPLEGES